MLQTQVTNPEHGRFQSFSKGVYALNPIHTADAMRRDVLFSSRLVACRVSSLVAQCKLNIIAKELPKLAGLVFRT